MIELFRPRGRTVAGLYYKGELFYTLFMGYHIIVKQLCSFNKDEIKSVKKVRPSGLQENMLIKFHCPEKLPSCKLTITDFLTTVKFSTPGVIYGIPFSKMGNSKYKIKWAVLKYKKGSSKYKKGSSKYKMGSSKIEFFKIYRGGPPDPP